MTNRWRYGGAQEKYGVQEGDVWHVGERHVLVCGDLEKVGGRLLGLGRDTFGEDPVMMYVDPPWNPAMVKAYRTKAELPTPPECTFESLIDRILDLTPVVAGCVFVEIGAQKLEVVVQKLQKAGFQVHCIYSITYLGKKPGSMVLAARGDLPGGLPKLEGLDDEKTFEPAIQWCSVRGNVVLDPCLGQGGTAVAAEKLRRRCLGLELNPRRMARAIERLAELGCRPKLVERI